MGGYYDPAEYSTLCGLVKVLLSYNGMPKLVLEKATFWLLLSVQIGLLSTRVLYANGIWSVPLPTVEWSSIKNVTSLLTFFIVFYGGSMYSRYQQFYGHCVGLGGDCMEWCALVRQYFPHDQATTRWNCVRHVLASLHVLYFSLNEPEPGEPDIGDDEWDTMRQRQLMTDDEIQAIKGYDKMKGYKPFLPLMWALEEVESSLKALQYDGAPNKGPEHAALVNVFRNTAFDMRGHCGQINNWLKQPVPFPYFQFLTLLLIVDLLLIAYGLTQMNFSAGLTVIIYIIILSSFIGLKEVAVAMSDPFGEDEIDFDTNGMLKAAYNNSVACLRNERPLSGAKLTGLDVNPIIKSPLEGPVKTVTVKVPAGYPPGFVPGRKSDELL